MSQGFPGSDPKPPTFGGSGIPNPYGSSGMGPGGSTYSPSSFGGPYSSPGVPPKPDRSGCIVGSIVAGILGAILLCCGGCGLFGYFALDADYKERARQLSVDYRNDPKMKEQVGEVQEISYNWGASLNEEDADTHIYDVRGDKGNAQIVAVEEYTDGPFSSVRLRNDKGEWPLPSQAEPEPMMK
jgi:hypothetical protein